MGVAGVAMMYGMISFCKLIGLLFKALSWSISGKKCTATVRDMRIIKENYKNDQNKKEYEFQMLVCCNNCYTIGTYTAVYNIKTDVLPRIGDRMDMNFDEKKRICRNFEMLKNKIGTEVLILIVCAAIFWGGYLLFAA